MAGSEHAGVEYARTDLLSGAPCIVTKDKDTDSAAFRKIVSLWAALGAKVKIMSPASHDRSVSLISHLPHIVAFSLAGAVPEKDLQYAAEGFKDTTRVASSDPELWADIFLTNRDQILRSGKMFERYYRQILKAVSRGDHAATVKALKKAKAKRDKFTYGKERP
jgi:prephenate dehydrogenase